MLLHAVKNSDEIELYGVDVKKEFVDDLKRFNNTVVKTAEDKVSAEDVLKQLVALMYERYAVMDEQNVGFWDDAQVDNQKTTVVFVGLTNELWSHAPATELLGKLVRLGKASGITIILFLHEDAATQIKGEFKANITTVFVLGEISEQAYSTVMVSDFAYHESLQNYDVLLYQNRAGQGTYPFVRNAYSWEALYRWVEQQNGTVEPELHQELIA